MQFLKRRSALFKLAAVFACATAFLNVLLWHQSRRPGKRNGPDARSEFAERMITTNTASTKSAKSNAAGGGGFHVVRHKMTREELLAQEAKPLHELSKVEPYMSRVRGIKQRCRHLQRNESEVELSQMVYDDKHKFVMCDVAKGASTTWRYIIWYLLGKVETQEELKKVKVGHLVLNRGNMPVLGSLERSEALKRLRTYTTFVVMRHPLSRLVSAHSSKLTSRNPEDVYKMRFGRPIAINQQSAHMHGIVVTKETNFSHFDVKSDPKFRKLTERQQSEVLKYLEVIKSGEIPFSQFARYVANRRSDVSYVDMHWRPQTSICNPCAVNYDYVIKFENLNEDSDRILEYLQRGDPPERQIRMRPRKALINSNRTAQQLATVDAETMEKLRRVYQTDLDVYGYRNIEV